MSPSNPASLVRVVPLPARRRPTRRSILISGASSGLGEGMARQWAAQGHDLALVARRLERLEALAEELSDAHPDIRVEVRELDVTDAAKVRSTFGELDAALSGIDRFVLNAGLAKGASIGTGFAYANSQTLQINAQGTLNQAEAALEILRTRGRGHLVFISSVAAARGMMGAETTYAASKAFVSSLAEGIRAELGREGSEIAITTIAPGFIDTDMTRGNTSPLKASRAAGVNAIVAAIEREPANAAVPSLPWAVIDPLLRYLPEAVSRRFI